MGWIVLILALIGAVCIAGLYLGPMRQVATLRQQLADRELRLAEAEAKIPELTQQLADAQTERKGLEEKLVALRTQLANGLADVERSRVDLTAVRKQYEEAKQEQSQLQTKLDETTSERDRIKDQLQIVSNEKTMLERSAGHARERLALLDRDYRQAMSKLAEVQQASQISGLGTDLPAPSMAASQETESKSGSSDDATASQIPGAVELPPIMVHKDMTVAVQPITGHVVQVDPVQRFAIVDRGSTHGVKTGMAFSIVRGTASIGRATVVRLRPDLSACDVLLLSRDETVRTGDLAVQIGS